MQSQLTVFEILKLHDSVQNPNILAKSIGDGFLFKNNDLYQKLRCEFTRLGYRFTTDDFCHYVAMPFLSLPEILKQKKVPYFDNVTPIQYIEKSYPKKFKCEEIIKPKTNHVLHESAHCIADEYLKEIHIKAHFLSKEQTATLQMIMAESFANTIESVCNYWNTTAELRLFYEMNSYIIHYKKISQALKESVELIGLKNTFHLVYISYLCSNCLLNEISQSKFNQLITTYFDPSTVDLIFKNKSVLKLFNHAFELSMDFRLQTTGFYCQMAGLKSDIFKLVDIDLVMLIAETDVIQDFLKKSDSLVTNNY